MWLNMCKLTMIELRAYSHANSLFFTFITCKIFLLIYYLIKLLFQTRLFLEPNCLHKDEKCVEIRRSRSNGNVALNDEECSRKRTVICQKLI